LTLTLTLSPSLNARGFDPRRGVWSSQPTLSQEPGARGDGWAVSGGDDVIPTWRRGSSRRPPRPAHSLNCFMWNEGKRSDASALCVSSRLGQRALSHLVNAVHSFVFTYSRLDDLLRPLMTYVWKKEIVFFCHCRILTYRPEPKANYRALQATGGPGN